MFVKQKEGLDCHDWHGNKPLLYGKAARAKFDFASVCISVID